MEEAAPFIRGDPRELASLINRMKTLKNLYPAKRLRAFPMGDSGVNANLLAQKRLSFMPPKSITEELIKRYLDTFEKNYPLLEPDEFGAELINFWTCPEAVDDAWLAQLYMMLALACYASPDLSFREAEFDSESLSSRCVDGAEAALLRRGHFMTKPDLTTLRVLALLAIGKQMDIVTLDDSDGAWIFMGFVMRVAMSMCLHIGPDAFVDMPQKEAVARRRVWNTLMLLDSTTALDSGMPLLLRPEDYDSSSLARTEARADEESNRLNNSLMTDELYQNLLADTAPLASVIINKSNSTRPGFGLDEIKDHDKNIRELLRKVQACTISQRTVLEVILHRCLLAIHQSCALNSASNSCHDPEHCRRTTHESALLLLHLQSDLHEIPRHEWLGELFVRDFGVAGLYVCDGLRNHTFDDTSDPVHSKSAAWSALRRLQIILKSRLFRCKHYFKIFKAYTALIAGLQALEARTSIRDALYNAGLEVIAAVEECMGPQAGTYNITNMVDPLLQLDSPSSQIDLNSAEFVSFALISSQTSIANS
jgi:hypothetical protein